MEHGLLQLRVHLWREVLLLRVEVRQVVQWLQGLLQALVLELMLLMMMVMVMMMLLLMRTVVVVVVVLLEVVLVVLIQKLLVCVRSKLLGLVFEELFKLLEGLLVCHEPLL